MKKLLLLVSLITFISVNAFSQAIPKQINYQGVLKNQTGTVVSDGNYSMTFKIYNDPVGGAAMWTETKIIEVAQGIFVAHLGSITPINGVPFDKAHFLGIQIGNETELSPRIMLAPAPYSFMTMDVIDNTVVKSLNGLKDNINIVGGSNISITPSGNNLMISASGGGTGIGGTGTTNYIPIFTNTTTLGNSKIFQATDGSVHIGSNGTNTILTLSSQDDVNEGGQMDWEPAGSYNNWYQDLYQNNMRLRTNSANTNYVEIVNKGTGTTGLNIEGNLNPMGGISTNNAITIQTTADSLVIAAGSSKIILRSNGDILITAFGETDSTVNSIKLTKNGVDISGNNININALMDLKMNGMNVNSEATMEYKIKGLNVTSEAGVNQQVKGTMITVQSTGPNTIKGMPVMIN
jgi:hypothetical protein